MISKEHGIELITRVNNNAQMIEMDIREMIKGEIWLTFGHDSWDSFCGEYLACLQRIGRGDRLIAVKSMTEQGLSTRIQAKTLGVDQKTVVNDQNRLQVRKNSSPDAKQSETPKPKAKTLGIDGKEYSAPRVTTVTRKAPKEDDHFQHFDHEIKDVAKGILAYKGILEPDDLDKISKAYAELGAAIDSLKPSAKLSIVS